MALPPVSWTVDGVGTPLLGWSATTTAFGGFGQMRGTIRESDARRIPSTVMQGSLVKGFTDGGATVFEGRLSAPPAIRGGLASFAAQGESVRAAKRATRLFYQTRDVSSMTDRMSPPFGNTDNDPEALDMKIESGSILWSENVGRATGGNVQRGAVWWSPGMSVSRYAFNWKIAIATASYDIVSYWSTGAGDAGYTSIATHVLSSATGTVDSGTGYAGDRLLLQLSWSGGAVTFGGNHVLLTDVRLNGIAQTDIFTGSQTVADVGQRLGYDTTGVTSTSLNVLPLDWTAGSWAELLSYIATLEDRYWRVVEDGRLEYDAWGTKEWTVYQADGATVDLTPLELYNQVTVKYVDVGGAPREVTVTASPDPLAASGIVNVWTESLSDVQADATLATAVANNLLPRVSTLREQGRINAVKAYDHTGREAVREIRAGDTIRVADRDMNTATTHRVFETDQDSEGVACGIETGVSIASLLGRAGLVSARAPSTAELPELEIAAVTAEPFPSEEQQHRDRFLTWPQGFPKRGTGHGRG